MSVVNFKLGDGFPQLMHDWRFEFRTDPARMYRMFREIIPDVPHEILDKFLKGELDVEMDGENPYFVESGTNLVEETLRAAEHQYIDRGEAVESYYGGIQNVHEFVKRKDYNWNEDYEDAVKDHIDHYRGLYDRAVDEFKKAEKSLEWFYRNWNLRDRQKPHVRSLTEIINAERLRDYEMTTAEKVDYHALVMTVDGKIWWYGEQCAYAIFQHANLEDTLFSLGVDVEVVLEYRPTGWSGNLRTATPEQINALVKFAMDRGEMEIEFNENKIPIENLLKFVNREISYYEIT